ncbi:hypothetical protein EXS71_02145 [Candidatus Uhrbacteria bacterium]|nr:hypothetical protein [Candidatus Uhrbacteria bacterium]
MSHTPEPTNRDIFQAIQTLQVDMQGVKEDVKGLKIDVRGLREDLNDHKRQTKDSFGEVHQQFAEMHDVLRHYASDVDAKYISLDRRVTKLERV